MATTVTYGLIIAELQYLCILVLYAFYFSYSKILVIFSISNRCLILSCSGGDRTLIRGNMVYTNRGRLCRIILLGTKS